MFLLCNACCFCLKLGAVGKVMEEKGKKKPYGKLDSEMGAGLI